MPENFEQNQNPPPEKKPEPKSKEETEKEWEEHFSDLAEIQKATEEAEKEKEKQAKETVESTVGETEEQEKEKLIDEVYNIREEIDDIIFNKDLYEKLSDEDKKKFKALEKDYLNKAEFFIEIKDKKVEPHVLENLKGKFEEIRERVKELAAETPETGTERTTERITEEEQEQPFKLGQQVRVKRTSGEFEDDWIYEGKNSLTGAAIVSKKISDNRLEDLVKEVDINDLRKWQEEPEVSPEPERREEGIKIDWIERGVEEIKQGKEPPTISYRLRRYLREQGFSITDINEMTPAEAWRKAIELYYQAKGEEVPIKTEEVPVEEKKVGDEGKKVEDWEKIFYEMGGTIGQQKTEEAEQAIAEEKRRKAAEAAKTAEAAEATQEAEQGLAKEIEALRERINELKQELAKEKEAIEAAEPPKEGMTPEDILKETGIEESAESFEEFERRLREKIEEANGERLSRKEILDLTVKFYLQELGYSLKYEEPSRRKVRVLDAEGKEIVNKKGKPLEFTTTFRGKKPRLIKFLEKELRRKLAERPKRELSEEEVEAGFQKAVNEAKQEQKQREEKISSLADVKKVGKERLSKLAGGLSYILTLDKLGILGMRKGKELAIKGGKDLAAIGLSPLAAVELTGRYVVGHIQTEKALRKLEKKRKTKELAQALEEIPSEERPEYYAGLLESTLESIKILSKEANEELIKGYNKYYKKGKIVRLIESLGGKASRPISRAFGPSPPPKAERR